MKRTILTIFSVVFVSVVIISCQDNHAAETGKETKKQTPTIEENKSPVKQDGPAIATIETQTYLMKLHRAFVYEPEDSKVLANTTPKVGHRFVYLDVSMRNIGNETLDGGMLFVALKVADKNGNEFKKPAMALASYASENPGATNSSEYDALWGKYAANEFHREIVYAVEIPVSAKELILKMPVDQKRKEWKEISFSI